MGWVHLAFVGSAFTQPQVSLWKQGKQFLMILEDPTDPLKPWNQASPGAITVGSTLPSATASVFSVKCIDAHFSPFSYLLKVLLRSVTMNWATGTSSPSTASLPPSTWSRRRATWRLWISLTRRLTRGTNASFVCACPQAKTSNWWSAAWTRCTTWRGGCMWWREWSPAASAGSSRAGRSQTKWNWRSWKSQRTTWCKSSWASP